MTPEDETCLKVFLPLLYQTVNGSQLQEGAKVMNGELMKRHTPCAVGLVWGIIQDSLRQSNIICINLRKSLQKDDTLITEIAATCCVYM